MNFLVFGIILAIWVGTMVFVVFNPNGKILGQPVKSHALVPLTFALAVWMWIFGLAIFGT